MEFRILEMKVATLLPRRNSKNFGDLLEHVRGNETRCDLVKSYTINEGQRNGNTPEPFRVEV